MLSPVNAVPKSTSLSALELPNGDHWVHFHVEEDTISFEVASATGPSLDRSAESGPIEPTGFVQRWGGSARKIEDSADPWLRHLNEKHLRSE
jgi:hypothetical protein